MVTSVTYVVFSLVEYQQLSITNIERGLDQIHKVPNLEDNLEDKKK